MLSTFGGLAYDISLFTECRNKFKWTVTLQSFFIRHQTKQSAATILKSGIGGMLAIATICLAAYLTDNIVLMAPFGASCVLLFSLPQSPLSQPINVVAGHIVSTP